jgi:hypothetical protein
VHIYAFGSICRGEVELGSDVDLLALVNNTDLRFDPNIYSIYSYERINQIWNEGNPFAWHLFYESRSLYSDDAKDYLKLKGKPSAYTKGRQDCRKFYSLFCDAKESLNKSTSSNIFDASNIFLSIRNIATCFSLASTSCPDFSRNSALKLGKNSLVISEEIYAILERSRILCTRGYGKYLELNEIEKILSSFNIIDSWMKNLINITEKGDRANNYV